MGTLEKLETSLDMAINDAQYWPDVCDEIAQLLGGNNALLIPSNPNFRGLWLACTKTLAPALEQYIAEEWHLNDFRHKTIPIAIERGYATDDDILLNRRTMAEMPYYTDFLWKHDIGFFIGIKILTPNGIWIACTYFNHNHPPITHEQIELTHQISALIEAKITQADIIAHKQISDFARFFKGSQSEIYILDPQGEDCLNVNTDGKLSGQTTTPQFLTEDILGKLHDEISHICSSEPELSLSNSYIVKQGYKRINVLAIQIPPFLRHFHMPFKVCIIATEVKERIAETHDRLRAKFALTTSEITALELLARGNSPKSIAELLSVKPSSIRQRLKTIYDKTNVSGQVELVSFYNNLF